MTPQQKRWTVIWGLVLVPLLPFLVAAIKQGWDQKEGVAAHAADIKDLDGKVQRVLDVVCQGREQLRACKP